MQAPGPHRGQVAALALVLLLVAGCAAFHPPKSPSTEWRSRAVAKTAGDVTVSAVLLSREEAQESFNTRVVQNDIQPIWLEVDNRSDEEYALMLLSVDPDYFSPSEAAWRTRRFLERRGYDKIGYFNEQHVELVVPPKSRREGFVYANYDPGAKAFAVELIGGEDSLGFEFVLPVPGFQADFMERDEEEIYAEGEIRDVDLDGLRAFLESIPCCVLGGDKETFGDPANLVIVGDGEQALATFIRRGWDLTETVTTATALRTAWSSVFGALYRTSPVSPLYMFGRSQDVALQKARGTVDERNHLRLWLAPVTFQGQSVFIGQISRDIGVKLSRKTVVTHRIDPVVDEARTYVLLDLAASGYVESFAFVKGVGVSEPEAPRKNYTLDPYVTDGLRVVIFMGDRYRELAEVEWLAWEEPPSL